MRTCDCCDRPAVAHGLCKGCYERMVELLEAGQDYQLSDTVAREHGADTIEMGEPVMCSECQKWKIHIKCGLCLECFFEYCVAESERNFWD